MTALEKYLDQLNYMRRLFNEPERPMPTNTEECADIFESLRCDLSPENLHCDGEITAAQARKKAKYFRTVWLELEAIQGHEEMSYRPI